MALVLMLVVPWLAPLLTAGLRGDSVRSARTYIVVAFLEVPVTVFAVAPSGDLSGPAGFVPILVAGLGAFAFWTTGFKVHGITAPRPLALYRLGLTAFWWSLLVLSVSRNLGLSWAAIELTTITSAALVAISGRPTATEAAWKYAILCSAGLLLALLGVLLLLAAGHAPGHPVTMADLDFSTLARSLPSQNAGALRLALILLAVGFGTKAGFAPMHTWLPDAHSEAPAPVSGLLSGILLPLVLLTLWHVMAVASPAVGTTLPRELLIGFGLLTVVVATPFLLVQTDLKRLLAYSTLEQMGLLAIGLGIGTHLALDAVFLQLTVHALVKSGLFSVSGDLLETFGTKQIPRTRGLLAAHPRLGWPWLIGLLTLGGLPPLPLFLTELAIVFALFAVNAILGAMLVACLLVIFIGMAHYVLQTTLGSPRMRRTQVHDRGSRGAAVSLSVAVMLGTAIPFMPGILQVLAGGRSL